MPELSVPGGAWYWAPPDTPPPSEDAALDQGDVCDEDGHAHDAPVTAGVCGWCGEEVGEWIELGALDLDRVEASGAAALRAEETARRALARVNTRLCRRGGKVPGGGTPADIEPRTGATVRGSLASPEDSADKGRSDTPVDTRSPVHASFRAVPVPSPAVTTGLGREHIDTHRHIPAPGRVELPEALGGLAGDAPEQQLVRYNRADRRRAAKTMRRQARRG